MQTQRFVESINNTKTVASEAAAPERPIGCGRGYIQHVGDTPPRGWDGGAAQCWTRGGGEVGESCQDAEVKVLREFAVPTMYPTRSTTWRRERGLGVAPPYQQRLTLFSVLAVGRGGGGSRLFCRSRGEGEGG